MAERETEREFGGTDCGGGGGAGGWGGTAANEVLREIHNALGAALKHFSRQGVFLYGPQAEVWPGRVGEW